MILKDIIKKFDKSNIKAGDGLERGKYPLYTCSSIINKYLNEYLYEDEALIISTGGNFSIHYVNGKFNYSTDCYVFNTDKYNLKYLYYYLLSKKDDIKKMFRGAGLKHLNKNEFVMLNIKDISLNEQCGIVNQLDKVNEIIELRKNEIEKCNNLIKSQFVEMFKNVNETVRLGDCCDVHARIGWQALTSKEHMKHGDYMLITGTDFKNNEIDYSTCVYVTKERYEMDEHIILKNDDILITKDGTIGKVAIVHNLPKPSTLNGGVFVVRPDERFNKEYITYVFKGPLFEKYVNKSKTGATIKHLNQKHLVEFCIPMPSLEEQLKFSEIYKQIDKQKFVIENLCQIIGKMSILC